MEIFSKGIKAILLRDDIRFMFQAFRRLPEKERLVLYHRFGLDHEKCYTLDETSKLLKLSRERVRQLQVKALNKLRQEFRNIDIDYQTELENERQRQEKLRKEQEQQQQELWRKKAELEVRQEIREKVRQWQPSKRKSKTRARWEAIANTEHYKFISSFDFSEYDVKRFKRLELSKESISERIRTVVAELHPELILHEIKQWKIIGEYLVTDYQPVDGAAYRRIDIYLPYFLAPKKNRERFINELRPVCHLLQDATIEEILRFLKLND